MCETGVPYEIVHSAETAQNDEKTKVREGTFIIMRGLPGSGKSTLADRLKDKYEFTIVDPDESRESEEFRQYCEKREESDTNFQALSKKQKLYRFNVYQTVEALNSGEAVLWNQPWTNYDGIAVTLENVAELTDAAVPLFPAVIEVDVDIDTARERVEHRFAETDHTLTIDLFNEHFAQGLEHYKLQHEIPYMQINGSNPLKENETYLGYFLDATNENYFDDSNDSNN